MINVAINGFGRIGRNFLRAVLKDELCQDPAFHLRSSCGGQVAKSAVHPELVEGAGRVKVVAINVGPASLESVAHMFKYDTLMGIYPAEVKIHENELEINGSRIFIVNEIDPKKIEWHKYGVDWVVEATGKFTHAKGAQLHINSGAKKVLITAPAKDEDVTIIPGVNDRDYNPEKHAIVSLGSCTTNAIAPTLKILHDTFGIQYGFMTTIHAYTNTQVLLDVEKKDLRRARAAALNIIPTTTGATEVIGKVIPELTGIVGGTAVRVPVAKVSLIDLTFVSKREISAGKINNVFLEAAKEEFKHIVDISMEPLVSSDYSANNHSVVIDGLLTDAVGNVGKIFGWYDNEWGYSVRLKDFLMCVAE